MLDASRVGAELWADAVPVFAHVRNLAARGIVPGGTARNLAAAAARATWDDALDEPARVVLTDAQTSGGLLLAVPAENHEGLLAALGREGVPVVATIGRITRAAAGSVAVLASQPK